MFNKISEKSVESLSIQTVSVCKTGGETSKNLLYLGNIDSQKLLNNSRIGETSPISSQKIFAMGPDISQEIGKDPLTAENI